MADDIAIPLASEPLAQRDGKATSSWYRVFARLVSSFNAAVSSLSAATVSLATKAASSQPEAMVGTLQVANNGDYTFYWPYDSMTITDTKAKCASGTATLAFKKNGSPLSGSNHNVSSVETDQAHNDAISKGDTVTLTVSSGSSCLMLQFIMSGTRILA